MLTGRTHTADRVLAGFCALVWLVAIGVGVAAIVALVRLGSGHAAGSQSATESTSGTPWVLYAVIGISAAIIVASVPLLLRARRAARVESVRPPAGQIPGRGSIVTNTEKLRVFGSAPPRAPRPAPPARFAGGLPPHVVDAVWLRFTLSLASAAGAATLAVATATYYLGVQSDGRAWIALGVAAVITAAMPAIPWRQLRRLRATLAAR